MDLVLILQVVALLSLVGICSSTGEVVHPHQLFYLLILRSVKETSSLVLHALNALSDAGMLAFRELPQRNDSGVFVITAIVICAKSGRRAAHTGLLKLKTTVAIDLPVPQAFVVFEPALLPT